MLADIKGVSKQAVSKAVQRGLLISKKKGGSVQIDLDHKLTKLYLKNISRQEIEQKHKQLQAASKIEGKRKYTKKVKSEAEKYAEERANNLEAKRLAELDKINAVTNKINIEIAERTKNLIPKDLCDSVFQRMSSVMVNYFMTLGERLAPEVTGICKINDSKKMIAVKERIDEEVERCIKQFKNEVMLKKND